MSYDDLPQVSSNEASDPDPSMEQWRQEAKEDRAWTLEERRRGPEWTERTIEAQEAIALSMSQQATAMADHANNQRHLFLTLNDVLSVAGSLTREFLKAYQDRTKAMREDATQRAMNESDYNQIVREQG